MSEHIEQTLVLLKPESLERHLVGKILTRFEDSGLKIIALKLIHTEEETAKKHYREEIAKKYGEKVRGILLKHLSEGPLIALILEGVDSISVVRKLVGSTYPNEALPGTIRGDFGHISKLYANSKELPVRNLIHASDSKESAKIEIPIWFSEKEIISYSTSYDSITHKN